MAARHPVGPLVKPAMNSDYQHRNHFRAIAPRYRDLRLTDEQPIACIAQHLRPVPAIEATDIGCGTGRYTRLLSQYLSDRPLHMYCIDYSSAMLRQLQVHFAEHGLQPPITIKASAMYVPLKTESLNCIFTFNAIHHFVLAEFLHESARILRAGGYLFVYTRSRTQNSRTIWGTQFPLFASKETRLYELNELESAISTIPTLSLEGVQTFRFRRQSKLAYLIDRAHSHHYSTFALYSPREFSTALRQFARNLLQKFDKPNNIRWVDENILLILRKNV
jgi:ubiquinone/menaquinone biosynthesis C-methylase UbiE